MFENNALTMPLAYILVLFMCLITLALFCAMRWMERDLCGRPKLSLHGLFGFMMAMDLCWSLLEYSGHQTRLVTHLANATWYISFVWICYRWHEDSLKNLGVTRLKALVPRWLRLAPVVLCWLFVASSWWTRWVTDATPSGCYLRGRYVWVAYAVAFFYLFATVVVCVSSLFRTPKRVRRRFALTCLMATGLMIVSAYLQYRTGFAFVFIGVIITMVTFDFDAQYKAYEVLSESFKARQVAFMTVNHDIRTPLNSIIGFAELLKDERSEARRREMEEAIAVSGQTLMQLVNDVLDMSKMEAGKLDIQPEPTDVAELVGSIRKAFSGQTLAKGLAMACDVSCRERCLVDPVRIRQILFNLVGNAVKFTEKGEVRIRAGYADGQLSLAVSDTGCGIAEDDQRKLMTPYVQVGRLKGRQGTGLGLSISKSLAELMGGRLTLESALGRGTTFTVVLPCETCPAAPVAQIAEAGPDSFGRHRILVVDDVPMNRKVISAMLEKLGQVDVVQAGDGGEALDLLKSSPARFELVLTDLQMAGMDGDVLVREIHADDRLAHLRVHAITGDMRIQAEGANLGFDGVLVKPVTLNQLRQVLKTLEG